MVPFGFWLVPSRRRARHEGQALFPAIPLDGFNARLVWYADRLARRRQGLEFRVAAVARPRSAVNSPVLTRARRQSLRHVRVRAGMQVSPHPALSPAEGACGCGRKTAVGGGFGRALTSTVTVALAHVLPTCHLSSTRLCGPESRIAAWSAPRWISQLGKWPHGTHYLQSFGRGSWTCDPGANLDRATPRGAPDHRARPR